MKTSIKSKKKVILVGATIFFSSLFLLNNQHPLKAEVKIEKRSQDCTEGWRVVGFTHSCVAGIKFKYREDRKYIFCGGQEIPTDEYRSVFTGIEFGC